VLALVFLLVLPTGAFSGVAGGGSAGVVSGAGTIAAAESSTATHVAVPKSSAYDWPELHQNPQLRGYAYNSPLSSSNASELGVGWATNLYGSALDSPVVAYDPILGETLAYIGTEPGNVLAINIATGQIVWGVWLGSPIRSSPLVYDGAVYVGTFTNPTLFKLNATTGATEASVISPRPFEATPTVATPPGGVPTIYIGTVDTGPGSGPFMAINAENLSIEWKFTGYNHTAGSWNSASYAVSASGVPIVLFGTDNPDSSVYALNALTGKLIWRFQTYNPDEGDWDVAAGVTISLPGVNGFAQGVAYAVNKIQRAYALSLNNGTLIWETNFAALAGITTGVSRSTPALDGSNLVFGYANGLFDLNATTGARIWMYEDPTKTESLAAPAIAGGHGTAIVVTGDIGGDLDVVSVIGGGHLYTYQTGGYITASPVVSDGNILIDSSNGILYDFTVGGGNDAVLPTTTVTYPSSGSTLTNPSGNLTVTGSATDPTGVAAVNVAIQSGGPGGPWWDATTETWSTGAVDSGAVLGTPGAHSTSWSLAFPVVAAGGTFEVFAYAVSGSGQSDILGSGSSFTVGYSISGPHFEASPTFVAPGGTVTLNGGGFGASTVVNVTLHGEILAAITSRSNGSLPPTRVVIPSDSSFGLAALTAAGPSPEGSSTAAITITNGWEQSGYNSGHVGSEPNDPVFNYLIFPGGDNWVKLAWHFDPGVSITASPAVADEVAYVADTAGQLFAVSVHNGGLLWTYTLSSKATMQGSPAVDPTLGLVFVGANDGTLNAVYTANGTLAWSTSVGGEVAAPVYANGEVYVSSSSGTVKALSESSGAVSWTTTLASSVTAAPSLNTTERLLVVGESNGDVVGLNSSTGAVRWSYLTGGAITASATISGGSVYIGSGDDYVYALSASTGHRTWSFKTGGPVKDTGSLLDNNTNGALDLIIGSSDGKLYLLRAATGSQVYNVSAGSPIVGVSTAMGIAVFETAKGTIGASRTYVDEYGWRYKTGAGLATTPVLVNGTIYACAEDGNLYAFTATGQPPV
jgi:outer membrane protein assembly factor BamB